VISATAFNALTADLATGLSTCLTKDGQTNPTANIPMANYKFTGLGTGTDATDSANLSQVQSTVVKLIGTISGADTITGSLVPALTAYAAGQMFYFVAAGDNTGAVTLNINSLGAKNVTKNGATALAAAEIKSGQTVAVIYDGTRFQIVNPVVVGLTGITTTTTTALGVNAGNSITSGTVNTCIGHDAGTQIDSGSGNTAVGDTAGGGITSGSSNTVIGSLCGYNITTGDDNTFVGRFAGSDTTTQNRNTYIGRGAAIYRTSSDNTAVGYQALLGFSGGSNTGAFCTAVGSSAGQSVTSGSWNTMVGYNAGVNVTTGVGNTLIGYNTGAGVTTGTTNSALGDSAYLTGNYGNSTCLGYDSAVTGSNQVQLGNSSTTAYAYGAVQDRSDLRDKTDIRDTQLGLTFIMALRPRDFKWDMREDYRTKPPATPNRTEYETDDQYQVAFDQWKVDFAAWEEANKLANITRNGTHTRTRYHQGLIAQEVKADDGCVGRGLWWIPRPHHQRR
jgi:hypothetical protein